MALKRALFVWSFAAAVVLPVWILLGYALQGASVSGVVGILLLAPVVLVVELGLALLVAARSDVRRVRALDLRSAAVLGVFQVAVLGVGFFGPATAWFGVLAVAGAIGGLWWAGSRLVRDVRSQVRATMASFGVPAAQPVRTPIDAGEYVVVKARG